MRAALWLLAAALAARAEVPAFPGAEGFGADTPGGRGGDVYHVTNLDDSGPGSLRAAIETAAGPRTVVFDVSGTIELASPLRIDKPFLTLAGQTAPGDGITLAGWNTVVSGTHDVIVRYLRFRAGDTNCPRYQEDAFTVDKSTAVMVDHVSASWSIDETLSVTNSDRVTVQWSFITESLNRSCHEKGAHGYGSLLRYGNGRLTFHHNLYAHHASRNPRVGDELSLDFVNNVIYDFGGEAGYSGEAGEGVTRLNYNGNYVAPGPSTSPSRRDRAFNGGSENTRIYQAGNRVGGEDTGWDMFAGAFTRESDRFDFAATSVEEASGAYARVLAGAGASLSRDAVDRRIAAEVAAGTGHIVNSQVEAGGWPPLTSLPAPPDTDADGIPDVWEIDHGLDPHNPEDGAALAPSGYTNLEVYLDKLASPPDGRNNEEYGRGGRADVNKRGARARALISGDTIWKRSLHSMPNGMLPSRRTFLSALGAAALLPGAQRPKPNVVVILADDLGYGPPIRRRRTMSGRRIPKWSHG